MKLKCTDCKNTMFIIGKEYEVLDNYKLEDGYMYYEIKDKDKDNDISISRLVRLDGLLWKFKIIRESEYNMNENTWTLDITPEGEYVLYLQSPFGIRDMYITAEEAELIISQTSCEVDKLPF